MFLPYCSALFLDFEKFDSTNRSKFSSVADRLTYFVRVPVIYYILPARSKQYGWLVFRFEKDLRLQTQALYSSHSREKVL